MGREGNLGGWGGWRRSVLWIALGCGLVALLLPGSAGAAEAPPFEAHGSVEQVYATGLTPGAPVSLYDGAGPGSRDEERQRPRRGPLSQRRAGRRLPRRRPAGTKSAPLQVLTTASAPPSTDFYDQSIPASGYGYLTTRDGTKLAIDVHPPQDVTHVLPGVELPPLPAGPTPTLIEYSGYGYAEPGRARKRDLDHRQPDGLHGRRRQHARHRLLGRRLRLLRAAAEPRRLRRRRDGRPPALGR